MRGYRKCEGWRVRGTLALRCPVASQPDGPGSGDVAMGRAARLGRECREVLFCAERGEDGEWPIVGMRLKSARRCAAAMER